MDGRSGSGCGCCSCGCLGCLAPLIAIIMAIIMIFAVLAPWNRNFEHMIPNDFQEYFPDFNNGSSIPAEKGTILPCYEFAEFSAITYRSILTEF